MENDLPDESTAVVVEINEVEQIELLKKLPLDIPESPKEGRQVIDGYLSCRIGFTLMLIISFILLITH